MTNEQKKTNSEQSTENHEVSIGMVHVPPPHSSGVNSSNITRGFKTQSAQTTADGHENCTVDTTPVGYSTSHGMFNHGLPDNLILGEKRKLQSLSSENFVSGLECNDCKEKRFKSDATQNIYLKRNGLFNELNQPCYFGKKSMYYSPSFKQNAYLTLNGISKDVSRKVDFNFNALSDDTSAHLSGFKPKKINQEEMSTLNNTSPVELENNLTGVGETESMRHGERSRESFSKNVQEKTTVEANFASNSQEFYISLDSTKSSFLTQIKKIRQNAECNAIPCPFCSQTFYQYPDLKIHVETHKYANISEKGIKRNQRSLCENQSRASTNGNSMVTPVSTPAVHSPHPPSRMLSTGDDGVIRATSVIQFAEKKNKERAGK